MIAGVEDALERRVLILTPIGKDARLIEAVLQPLDIECFTCVNLVQACEELAQGAGALLLAEEAIVGEGKAFLTSWLGAQPTWSDLPLLVFARAGTESVMVARATLDFENVTVIERPLRSAALVSVVRAALRARQRQYDARMHLARIEQSERDLREFLAVLSHELRNPLAPILNSLYVFRHTHQNAEVNRASEIMERQVNHMVRLVDDLLEVSRITRGKIELRKERLALAAIVQGAVEAAGPLIDAAQLDLTITIPSEALLLQADPVRLTQIIANLLNNAAKYTDTGGRIWLTVSREQNEAVVSVRDTGIGIEPALLPRVFELFMQLKSPAGRGQGGLGIGLALARSLVELHGGSIEARSEGAGQGSEFIVRLPLETEEPDRATGERVRARPVVEGQRLLVVDDNHDVADSLAEVLGLLGAEVRVAYDGAGALELMRTYHPDAVLLDIGMPQMDGYEVARRIRRDPGAREVRIIALTGWGQQEDRERTRAAGFDQHLVKPADLDALQEILHSLHSTPG